MKQEHLNVRLCFICHKAPVKKICLNEDCIKNDIYLFCDGCKRDDRVRKYLSQIYEIDAFSNPFCLFSINSSDKQDALKVQQSIINCRESMRENLLKIYSHFPEIENNIIENMVQLSQTYNPQKAEQVQFFFLNPSDSNNQLLKKVDTLKWFKQNKEFIQNSTVLSQKITDFSQRFNIRFKQLSSHIENLLKQFTDEFSIKNFFTETKKPQKPVHRSKQNVNKNRNTKINRKNEKVFDKKPQDEISQVLQKSQHKEANHFFKQNGSQYLMDLEQSKESQKPLLNSKSVVSHQNLANSNPQKFEINFPSIIEVQKQQDKNKVSKKSLQNPQKKKKSKPKQQIEKPIIQKQMNIPPLVLSKIPTKQDYSQNEKLIVNLRNIASIIWSIDQKEKCRSEKQVKKQNQVQIQFKETNQLHFQIDSHKLQKITLQKIKYLQIQELPKSQRQTFYVLIDGKLTQIVYSWIEFQEYLQQMMNLQQMHIFTTLMFLTEQQFLSILLTCPSLKVVTFNCLNPATLALEGYKTLIEENFNEELKILQVAGNIPYQENLQFYDLKTYYPKNQKNKKIYDENFVHSSQNWIKSQFQECKQELNKKQDFPHKNSFWFYRQDLSILEKERFQTILTSNDNLNISKCFSDLRNCWIPYLQREELQKIQINRNLNRIQHLTLGFHYIKLQVVPQQFYFGPSAFRKSLHNLKSLNLVNLHINELFTKTFFKDQCKELLSFKVQFCLGLKKTFYSDLPKFCPKLKKIAVNNMAGQIDGDFIFNLSQLQTIILPWSEIQYKGSQNLNGHVENNPVQNHMNEKDIIEQEGHFQKVHYKKWKYINIYGCTWFHTDFFALIDLKGIQHLNIGKCSNINIEELVQNLKNCENLLSLCIDELPISNNDLFQVLNHLPKLTRLSVAHCPNLDFRAGKLATNQVQLLDKTTHLDLRNQLAPIDNSYTLQMKNPKYLVITRPFDVESNQLFILTQRQIYTSCAKF